MIGLVAASECKRHHSCSISKATRRVKRGRRILVEASDSFQARVSGVKRAAIPFLPIHPSIYSDLTLTTHYSNSLTHMPPPTFTWVLLFPRGIKLTGPVWFRQVGCQCSLQAHGEPWIMDLPWVWVPLGVPAAPSPHSCCAWNSQCPINNQWFIKVLTASTQEIGNVKDGLLMGDR